MDKFKNKYRIPTNRLQGYDYSANGCYFVTICTKNRKPYFGEIVNVTSDMETDNNPSLRKTEIAGIAEKLWLDIPNHFSMVELDEFVIMPNHIHGLLVINRDNTLWQSNQFGRQSQNLGSIIRGFKSTLKRYANKNKIDFAWQERFYDRIIRNNNELENVRSYIFNNPQNWNSDEYYQL